MAPWGLTRGWKLKHQNLGKNRVVPWLLFISTVPFSISAATAKRDCEENPSGYDFVFRYVGDDGPRYKQVNVLWGDENHKIICMVRTDVKRPGP